MSDRAGTWACSRCGEETSASYSYCRKCKAAYMREWRKEHPLTEEQRRRDTARSYANVYLRRGKLERGSCEVCGSPDVQMHHDDYDHPLDVRWLCESHHRQLHRDAGTNARRGPRMG